MTTMKVDFDKYLDIDVHIGSFATPEEASEAYMNKRKEFLHETEE